MEYRDEELIRRHASHDEQLKALYQEHLELKRRLEAFRNKPYLTTQEQIEKKNLQKLKLASKDRLMELLEHYRRDPG